MPTCRRVSRFAAPNCGRLHGKGRHPRWRRLQTPSRSLMTDFLPRSRAAVLRAMPTRWAKSASVNLRRMRPSRICLPRTEAASSTMAEYVLLRRIRHVPMYVKNDSTWFNVSYKVQCRLTSMGLARGTRPGSHLLADLAIDHDANVCFQGILDSDERPTWARSRGRYARPRRMARVGLIDPRFAQGRPPPHSQMPLCPRPTR